MSFLRKVGQTFAVAISASLLVAGDARGQEATAFPRFHLLAAVGPARGADNQFADVALTGGLRVKRAEVRLRIGSMAHLGGCDAIIPTKCGAGSDGYSDATIAVHLAGGPARISGWTLAAGPGVVHRRGRIFLGAALGRDLPLGARGLLRLELHGRHIFDDEYRLLGERRIDSSGSGSASGYGAAPVDDDLRLRSRRPSHPNRSTRLGCLSRPFRAAPGNGRRDPRSRG